MSSTEEWKSPPRFSKYLVSSCGRFKSRKSGRIHDPEPNTSGQLIVNCINDEGKEEEIFLYYIIASIFISNPDDLPFVRHINGNYKDNRVENLEWTNTWKKAGAKKKKVKKWKDAEKNAVLREKLKTEEVEPCEHKQRKIVEGCLYCFSKSFASNEKSDYWSEINNVGPETIFKKCGKKYYFDCDQCLHSFDTTLNRVSSGGWCSYHTSRKLCANEKCEACFDKSFASHPKSKQWSNKNILSPREVFKKCSAKKFWFDCDNCKHLFDIKPADVTFGIWCSYCSTQGGKLCDDSYCDNCFNRSFASHPKAEYWDSTKNNSSPRNVFKHSNFSFWFSCRNCRHSFCKPLCDINKGHWCSYCSSTNGKLCDDDHCENCYDRSFASCLKSKYWSKRNKLSPRDVFKSTGKKYFFDCEKCSHLLHIPPSNVIRGGWCVFCAKQKSCGIESCSYCAKICDICKTVKARRKTRKRGLNVCHKCFDDCIKRDPEETPLQYRSKLTLEIYTLAELQRQSLEEESSFLFYEPTVWDCPIFPGSDRKPDNAWLVDNNSNILITAGACKINTGEISYALILEVLEHSREEHSKARDVSDEKREQEIRNVFAHIPVGFLYVTMAHIKHRRANKEDVFFEKNVNGEYEIIEGREEAFQKRMSEVRAKLVEMYINKANKSYYIGN